MKTSRIAPGRTVVLASIAAALLTACGGAQEDAHAPSLPTAGIQSKASVYSQSSIAAPVDYRSQSLHGGPGPRPGPAVLYADAPRAPQLENTGIWKASPILVSGASAYREGEYLYQDYLYDDRGAQLLADPQDLSGRKSTFARSAGTYRYPSDPVYAGNAADIVELRIQPRPQYTALRMTLNTLLDPEKVGFSVAIGDSLESRPFPFGANVKAPAQYFLTVHGNQAVLTDALTGAAIAPAPTVTVDTVRRQFQVDIPATAWSPGRSVVRFAAGVGLWDAANGRYLLPAPIGSATLPGGAGLDLSPAAFFNVAFRFDETTDGIPVAAVGDSTWRDRAQAKALAAGDIRPFYAYIDFGKLADKVDDELRGQPQGVPTSGTINRIFASRLESKQGVVFSTPCGDHTGCKGQYRGQLQPYSLYIPVKTPPASGYGLTLLLHSLAANHNQYAGTNNEKELGERGQGHLVASPLARGTDGWYVEDAETDVFEMWADIARHYRLNPAMTSLAGYSMGGYATFMFATRYPDLFASAHASAAGPSIGNWVPPFEPLSGDATNTYHMLPSLRHVPFLIWTQQLDEGLSFLGAQKSGDRLAELQYRHRLDVFPTAEHLTLYLHDSYAESARFMGDAVAPRDPAHVSFVANPAMDFPGSGLVADHAYWVSDITVRDTAVAPRGTVDVISRAFGEADPVASPLQHGIGALVGNLVLQSYVSQFMTWNAAASAPASDRLEIKARNIHNLRVDMRRARLSCNAVVSVDTDGPVNIQLDGCNSSMQF